MPARLFAILQQYPDGLSEYDLLHELHGASQVALARAPFHSELALFQAHFLLFNALYRLRDQLIASGAHGLDIHVLRIVLTPGQGSPTDQGESSSPRRAISAYDPLRDYYLDIHQLAKTGADEVAQLLGDFWMAYFAVESRAAALAELGLVEPVDMHAIRRRYRELAMRLHPDRGGDPDAFRRLLSARQLLERTQPGAVPHRASKRT